MAQVFFSCSKKKKKLFIARKKNSRQESLFCHSREFFFWHQTSILWEITVLFAIFLSGVAGLYFESSSLVKTVVESKQIPERAKLAHFFPIGLDIVGRKHHAAPTVTVFTFYIDIYTCWAPPPPNLFCFAATHLTRGSFHSPQKTGLRRGSHHTRPDRLGSPNKKLSNQTKPRHLSLPYNYRETLSDFRCATQFTWTGFWSEEVIGSLNI